MKLDIKDIKQRAGLIEADSPASRKAWEEKYNKQQAAKLNAQEKDTLLVKKDVSLEKELLSAVEACVDDLKHYVSTHGAGPDKRLERLEAAIKAYKEKK